MRLALNESLTLESLPSLELDSRELDNLELDNLELDSRLDWTVLTLTDVGQRNVRSGRVSRSIPPLSQNNNVCERVSVITVY